MGLPRSQTNERNSYVVCDLGVAEYSEVYQLQKSLVERRKLGKVEDTLLFVEHPAVYTYGRKNKSPPLPVGVPSFSVERGGGITYHNPGQLVVYPILALSEGERDLHLLLRRQENVLIDVLAEFGIVAERRSKETGAWVVGKQKKIASIGVAVSNWVAYHGSALNVSNDLSGFLKVNPCGYDGMVMTSMAIELPTAPSLAEVKESYLKHFSRHFERVAI